jgi:hypothetical protein
MPLPVRKRTNHQGPHPDLKDCNAMRLNPKGGDAE